MCEWAIPGTRMARRGAAADRARVRPSTPRRSLHRPAPPRARLTRHRHGHRGQHKHDDVPHRPRKECELPDGLGISCSYPSSECIHSARLALLLLLAATRAAASQVWSVQRGSPLADSVRGAAAAADGALYARRLDAGQHQCRGLHGGRGRAVNAARCKRHRKLASPIRDGG